MTDSQLMLDRVDEAFGHEPVREAVRRKAIMLRDATEAAELGADTVAAAQRAADKLREIMQRGRPALPTELPTKQELSALDVCIRFVRPALLVQNDHISLGDSSRALTDSERANIENLLPGVASIGLANSRMGFGTGFLIHRQWIVTNKHVLDHLTVELKRSLSDARVRFNVEWDANERTPPVALAPSVHLHPANLDIVVLQLASDAPTGALPLSGQHQITSGTRIAVVGHPSNDARAPQYSKLMFGNKWGVKRVSPGRLLSVSSDLLEHDASTLGGNSGSPIIDIATGLVVGIHSSGKFAIRNCGIPATRISEITNWNN